MSNPLKTLNQLRAEYAYKCVMYVKNTGDKKLISGYKSRAKKLPQMITYNGLLTTLAFLKSKAKIESGKPNSDLLVLVHLISWLDRKTVFEPVKCLENDFKAETIGFLSTVYESWDASTLFLKTSEALAIAQWLKRIAEGELDDPDTD